MTDGEGALVLYDSIHDVMRAESTLKRAQLWCDLVPTPRQLSSECGMSLAIQGADLAPVLELLAGLEEPARVYQRQGEQFIPVELASG